MNYLDTQTHELPGHTDTTWTHRYSDRQPEHTDNQTDDLDTQTVRQTTWTHRQSDRRPGHTDNQTDDLNTQTHELPEHTDT